jgi:hypothetical protein
MLRRQLKIEKYFPVFILPFAKTFVGVDLVYTELGNSCAAAFVPFPAILVASSVETSEHMAESGLTQAGHIYTLPTYLRNSTPPRPQSATRVCGRRVAFRLRGVPANTTNSVI